MRKSIRFFAIIALIAMIAVDILAPLQSGNNEYNNNNHIVYQVNNNEGNSDGTDTDKTQVPDNNDTKVDEGIQENEGKDNSEYVDNSFPDENISYEERVEQLENDKGYYSEDSVLVSVDSKEEAYAIADELGISEENVRVNFDEEYAVFTLDEGQDVESLIRDNEKYASKLSPEYKIKLSDIEIKTPDYEFVDEYFNAQEYLKYINIGDSWNRYKGDGVTVAIIDTGIDIDNPEFAGRISKDSYNATTGQKGIEYVDDEHGHGTSVAGVLAAGDNDSGIVGIAPNVELLIIKCKTDEMGRFSSGDVLNALAYALEMNADVINMSLGNTAQTNIFAPYTELALDKDSIIVAAAGNESTSTLTWPAADPNVLGVGAIDTETGELASYSNYGENSDVVAPGNVLSCEVGGDYFYTMGTSLACPIVSGAVALYKQKNPYAEYSEILEMICASSVDMGALGEDWLYGYGELDMNALLCEEVGTITFDSLTDEVDTMTRKFILNHTLQYMPEPERNYLVFGDWYYTVDMTDAVSWYEDVFGQDTTLYANWINEDDGLPYTYVTLEDDTIEIRSYTGHRKFITVPSEIGGKAVTSIGDGAFADNSRIRKVSLPNTITNIEARAFQNCSRLQEINIPSAVTSIGESAFYGCARLSTAYIDMEGALTTIGSQAFAQCSSLVEVNIPKNLVTLSNDTFLGTTSMRLINVSNENTTFELVNRALYTKGGWTLIYCPANVQMENSTYEITDGTQEIGAYAFAYNRLNNVVIADSVQIIGENAFSYSSVTSINIPASVTSIKAGAFMGCSMLKTCEFAEGTTISAIPEYCFEFCTSLERIEVPTSVKSIEMYAFAYNYNLREVTLKEGLLGIACDAFAYTSISEIVIPATVVSILDLAFSCCSSLSNITFASGSELSLIGKYTFFSCSSLRNVDLPEGLTIIGCGAFSQTDISEITLPATMQNCDGAFGYCANLTQINVTEGNNKYVSVDGVLYSADMKSICAYPTGRTGTYSVEDNVTNIGAMCFAGAKITGVILPDSLTRIEMSAFSDCYKIQEINIPSGVTTIENCAFSACRKLETITLPSTLTSLGLSVFKYATALTSVVFEKNVQLSRIEAYTFYGTNIENITIPASVESMGMYVFSECKNLNSVTFEENSKLVAIQTYVFDGATNLKSVTFAGDSALERIEVHGFNNLKSLSTLDFSLCSNLTVIDNYGIEGCNSLSSISLPESVTYIGRFAFSNCSLLTSITIPSSVERIGRYAFVGCNNLNVYFSGSTLPVSLEDNWDYSIKGYYVGTSSSVISGDWEYVELSNGTICIIGYTGSATTIQISSIDGKSVSAIGSQVFKDNTSITEVTLPDTLNAIYDNAFEGTTALEKIDIPAGVTFIGKYCFYKSGLSQINFKADSQLVNIEKYAFSETGNLAEITVPATTEYIKDYAFYKSGIETVTFETGSCLKTIGKGAFNGTNIVDVALPGSVTEIKSNAFAYTTELNTVTFTDGEDLILGSNAFERSAVASIYITPNVIRVGEFCFSFCNNLTEINVDSGNTSYSSVDGVLYNKSQTRIITYPAGKTGEFVVSKNIQSIGYGAFESSLISGITFEDGAVINTIGYRAFYGCTELTNITLPDTLVSIDYYAFAACTKLEMVEILDAGNLGGIYEGAFYNDTALTSINIPDSVLEIGEYAFANCSSLTDAGYTETSSIVIIGDYAYDHSGLTSIVIPDTLTDIGSFAFGNVADDTSTSIVIPNTVEEIGYGALYGMTSITEISLPYLGQYLGDDYNNNIGWIFGVELDLNASTEIPSTLTTVNITDTRNTRSGSFRGCDKLTSIKLPEGITVIDCEAFRNCSSLLDFEFPSSVIRISSDAFAYVPLEEIELPEGVKTIDTWAFAFCGVKRVTIPKSVIQVYYNSFDSCWNIEEFIVDEDNSSVKSIDGVLFSKDGTELWFYPKRRTGEYVVPDGVKVIEDRAFSGSDITSIVFCDTLEEIGRGAFEWSGIVGNIHITANVKSIEIESFDDISQLESFTVAEENQYYKAIDGILYNYDLTKIIYVPTLYQGDLIIPDGISGVLNVTFNSLSGMTGLVIPEGVTGFEGYNPGVRWCPEIEYMVLPDSLTSVIAFNNSRLRCILAGEDIESEADDLTYWISGNKLQPTLYIRGNYPADYEQREYGTLDVVTGAKSFIKRDDCMLVEMEDGTASLVKYSGDAAILDLDSLYEGGISYIQNYAFNESNVIELKVSEKLKDVADLAFADSTIQSIDVSENDLFEEIDGVVYGDSVTEVIFVEPTFGGADIADTNISEEVLGYGWWNTNNETSSVQTLSGNGSIVMVVTGYGVDNPAYLVEMTSETEESTVYFTTTSRGDAWWYGAGSDAYVSKASVASDVEALDKYYVTITREDNCIYVTYKNAYTGKILWDEQRGTCDIDLAQNLNVYVKAQHGSCLVSWKEYEEGDDEDTSAVVNGKADVSLEPSTIHVPRYVFNNTAFYKNSVNWENGCLYVGDVLIATNGENTNYGKNFIKEGTRILADYAIVYNGSELVIPDTIEYMGFGCLAGAPVYTLEKITLPFAGSSVNNPLYKHVNNLFGVDSSVAGEHIGTTLEEFVITGGVSIPEGFFSHKSHIKRIYLQGDSIKRIEARAFYYCSKLDKLIIPDSVEYIGEEALGGCYDNLQQIILPESAVADNVKMSIGWALNTVVIKSFTGGLETLLDDEGRGPYENMTVYVYNEEEEFVPDEYDEFKKVYFAGEWYMANFYVDGRLIDRIPLELGKALHAPVDITKEADDLYSYTFAGWDITGDGIADTLPATLTSTIKAEAVFEAERIGYTIRFEDYDGTLISEAFYGVGETVEVPVNPTREGNAQYTYTFAGWDSEVTAAIEDKTYVAVYSETVNKYEAIFVDYDGTQLQKVEVEYGQAAELTVNEPTREGYEFAGWDGNVNCITANVTFTAQYVDGVNVVAVNFYDADNNLICVKAVNVGGTAIAPVAPEKVADKVYTYEFIGWDTPLENITATTNVKATYKSVYVEYTVTFVDDEGNVIDSTTYHYGDTVAEPDPTKEADEVYTYTFISWNKDIKTVTEDITYIASYEKEYVVYTVTFKDWDGEIISKKTYKYGDALVLPTEPLRESDEIYNYDFIGWDGNVPSTVRGNYTFVAKYRNTYIKYIVEFVNESGYVYATNTYHYGDVVAEPQVDTVIEGDEAYVFSNWNTAVTSVTGDATYVASFETKKFIGSSNTTIKLDKTRVAYDGTEKEPAVTLTRNGSVLVAGTDYVVEYSDNVEIGTATVTITGSGAYLGTMTATFAIVDASEAYQYGDVNGDDVISVLDMEMQQKHILGIINMDDISFLAADVNHDGVVNVLDMEAVQKHILGIVSIQ